MRRAEDTMKNKQRRAPHEGCPRTTARRTPQDDPVRGGCCQIMALLLAARTQQPVHGELSAALCTGCYVDFHSTARAPLSTTCSIQNACSTQHPWHPRAPFGPWTKDSCSLAPLRIPCAQHPVHRKAPVCSKRRAPKSKGQSAGPGEGTKEHQMRVMAFEDKRCG